MSALNRPCKTKASGNSHQFLRGTSAYKSGNFTLALNHWIPLARNGNGKAQYNVGRMYYFGDGVNKDPIEAYKWFVLAARRGSQKGILALKRLAPRMTGRQVREALYRVKYQSAIPL